MLRFWRYTKSRLPNPSGAELSEGVLSWISTSTPGFLLAITTLAFQTPESSPLFIFTSLPLLVRHCHRAPEWSPAFLARTLALVSSMLALNSLPTSAGLLDTRAGVMGVQGAYAALMGITTLVPVLVHCAVVSKGWWDEDGAEVALAFGVLWAGAWAGCSRLPLGLGRLGFPTPFVSDAESLAALHRWLGTAGADLMLGTTAYVTYQTGQYLLPVVRQNVDELRESMSRFSPLSSAYTYTDAHTHAHTHESERPTSRLGSSIPTLTPLSSPMQGTAPSPMSFSSSSFGSRQSPGGSSTGHIRDSTAASTRRKRQGKKVAGLVSAATWASLILLGQGDTPDLSASLDLQAPFGIAFVLPRPGPLPTIDDLVLEGQRVANRANLLVYPGNALVAYTAFERFDALDRMVEEVCKQYGVWVLLGVDSWEGSWSMVDEVNVQLQGRINEVVLLSPDGMIGAYSKQKLVPFIESISITRGLMPVPTWELFLPAPPGVNRTDWTPFAPHIRPIRISPAICLDSFHPSLFSNLDPLADLFVVPASAPSLKMGRHLVGRAESLAITHGVPVVLVASGRNGRSDGSGMSALLDGYGQHLHAQRGGRSAIVQVAIPYRDGKPRRRTGAEFLGTRGVLGAGIVCLGVAALVRGPAEEEEGIDEEERATPAREQGFPLRRMRRTFRSSVSSLFGHDPETTPLRAEAGSPQQGGEGLRSRPQRYDE